MSERERLWQALVEAKTALHDAEEERRRMSKEWARKRALYLAERADTRVVILLDGGDVDILENKTGVEVVVIPWEEITHDHDIPTDSLDDLDEALQVGDIDKAIRISNILTADPEDDY